MIYKNSKKLEKWKKIKFNSKNKKKSFFNRYQNNKYNKIFSQDQNSIH